MHSIRFALANAQKSLASIAQTPRLDAELLLMHCLKKPKAFLYHHDHLLLSKKQSAMFQRCLDRRLQGEPIAYIRHTIEFFSLSLKVTTDTLIPRPDTEILVEWVLNQFSENDRTITIADLGTGCGAIALAIANQRPNWTITATECCPRALLVAKENAKNLSIRNITFNLNSNKTHWCSNVLDGSFSAIIANPPYIDPNDSALSPAVARYEPKHALFADDQGLSDLKKIIIEAYPYLKPSGLLALEHGYQQAQPIRNFMHTKKYNSIKTYKDLANHDRLTVGTKYV
jgi:release factor glutamine methyltransferase